MLIEKLKTMNRWAGFTSALLGAVLLASGFITGNMALAILGLTAFAFGEIWGVNERVKKLEARRQGTDQETDRRTDPDGPEPDVSDFEAIRKLSTFNDPDKTPTKPVELMPNGELAAQRARQIEELIVDAYKRGFEWARENWADSEAREYLNKAALDYADKTLNSDKEKTGGADRFGSRLEVSKWRSFDAD